MTSHTAVWQLQEAKVKLSELIECTSEEPQLITMRGKAAAIVLSYKHYQKLLNLKPNLYEFMQNSPLRDADIDLESNIPWEERDSELFS